MATKIAATPNWSDEGLQVFMNDMKQTFVVGSRQRLSSARQFEGVCEGAFLKSTNALCNDLFVLLGLTMAGSAPGDAHCEKSLQHFVMSNGPEAADAAIDMSHARWRECPLFSSSDDPDIVRRWRTSLAPIAITDSCSFRTSIGMQVLLVPISKGAAAMERGARYVLISAAWSLAACHWQSGTRLGMALVNTCFSRLFIDDDNVLCVEHAAPHEHDIDAHHLAPARSLAHDYLYRGAIDHGTFSIFWETFVRAYAISIRWAHQAKCEWEQQHGEPLGENGNGETIHSDNDDGGMDASDEEAIDNETDQSSEDEGGTDGMVEDSDDCAESTISNYEFDYDAFDYEQTPYDDERFLLNSLARMFPRIRIVPPAEMTRLIDRLTIES